MISNIKKTISVYSMFSRGDRVLIGLSGGPDSVCLLYVMKVLAPEYGLTVFAAHLNHGFRGKESDGDSEFCRRLCAELGVPFYSKKVKIKKTEDAGRKARYSFFSEVAEKIGATKIALGHNADDTAETVLMRLLRGAGAKGLSGIQPIRRHGKFFIVRPLINMWKSEILDYLKKNKIKYRVDSSNFMIDFFRNKIRHELIPFLKKYNPNIKNVLFNLGKNMASTSEFLRDTVEKEYLKSTELKINHLKKLPQIVCQEVIRRAAQDFSPKLNLTADQVNSVLALISNSNGSKELRLPHNVRIVKEYNDLLFINNKIMAKDYKLKLSVPGRAKIPFYNILVISELCRKMDKKVRNSFEVKMDYDRMLRPIGVRNRRQGDVFQPIGFRHEKKLRDIFIDEKIPKRVRDFLPLVVSGKDICWIPGYRIGEKFKIRPETKKVIRIKVEGLEKRKGSWQIQD